MPPTTVTREMPQLSLRASFEPSTVNVEKRTVDLIWTTGAPVLRGGLFTEPYYEELSLDPKHVRMGRLQSGTAPLLNSHRANSKDDVLGVVENARLEPGRGVATVRFDSGPEGEDAFRRVREGTLRNVSVGYSTFKMQKVDTGENSSARSTPTFRAVDWEPAELSLAPIGADAGAVTRSGGGMTNPCDFIEERAMPPEQPETPANQTTITAPAPAPALAAPTAAPVADARSMAIAERERLLGIQRVARALNRPQAEVDAAIESGTSLEAFRAAAVDALATAAPEQGGPIAVQKRGIESMIQSGEDARDKWVRGASAWLITRAALGPILVEHAKASGQKVDLDPGEFRGLSLLDLARQSLERAGIRTAGMSKLELVGAAFTRGIAGGASTSDFPVLLENVMNKTLQARFAITADTWKRFCRVGSVADFRANPRYRQGSFGALSALGEGAAFTHKKIPDGEKQTLTASTKGNIIAITRQTIINDDMGAFAGLASDLGRSAALTIEVDVYALLGQNGGLGPTMSDGLTLFHATHKNIGAGAAIGSQAIYDNRVLMASQTDPSGNEILALSPAILVLPISLEGTARQINTSQYDFDALNTKNPWVPNKVAGVFRDIVGTPRLTGTRRYLFADPAEAAVVEVAFLDGMANPYLEMQLGWNVDGSEYKVRMDYGVGGVGFRGAVTDAG